MCEYTVHCMILQVLVLLIEVLIYFRNFLILTLKIKIVKLIILPTKESKRDNFIFTLRRQESCWVPGQVLPIFSLLVRPSVRPSTPQS